MTSYSECLKQRKLDGGGLKMTRGVSSKLRVIHTDQRVIVCAIACFTR